VLKLMSFEKQIERENLLNIPKFLKNHTHYYD